MGFFNLLKDKVNNQIKEKRDLIYQNGSVMNQLLKAEQADQEKTMKLNAKLTEEERNFINEFITRAKPFSKGNEIIYNFRGGNINFEIKGMQIGRISLNKRKSTMQIITKDDVKWITPITYEKAIKNIDKWIRYMKWLLSDK